MEVATVAAEYPNDSINMNGNIVESELYFAAPCVYEI